MTAVSEMFSSFSLPSVGIPLLNAIPSGYAIAFWVLSTTAVTAFIVLIGVIIVRTVYKIGFYGKQPFRTKHDLFGSLLIGDNAVINTNPPEWSRFCDVTDTTIVNGDNLSDETINNLHKEFGNPHWNKSVIFKREMVMTRETSYVVINRKKSTMGAMQGPIECVMTATPVSITFRKRTTKTESKTKPKVKQIEKQVGKQIQKSITKITLPAYNIEFSVTGNPCDQEQSQPFQICYATLHYFQQSNTPQAQVSLLRTNGLIWNVVPLCVIKCYKYKIDKELDYKFDVAKDLRFFVGKSSENVRSAIDFVDDISTGQSGGFETVITKELGDLLGLVSANLFVVIGCVIRGNIVGVLFFKDVSWTVFDVKTYEHEKTIELVGSVFDDGIGENVIQACFSRGLVLANRILKGSFLFIGDTSHNRIIIDVISKKGKKSVVETVNGLYIRNYRTTTRLAEKCLIVV